MVKDPGKLRLWRIAELLYEQTDEMHMRSAVQIDRIIGKQHSLCALPSSHSLRFTLILHQIAFRVYNISLYWRQVYDGGFSL